MGRTSNVLLSIAVALLASVDAMTLLSRYRQGEERRQNLYVIIFVHLISTFACQTAIHFLFARPSSTAAGGPEQGAVRRRRAGVRGPRRQGGEGGEGGLLLEATPARHRKSILVKLEIESNVHMYVQIELSTFL